MKKLLYILIITAAPVFCRAQSLSGDPVSELHDEYREHDNDSSLSDFDIAIPGKIDLDKDLKNQLLPVDSLIDIAIKNNPGVKMQEALIQSGEEQVKYARSEWMRNLSFNFNNSYGNSTFFYTTNESSGELQTQNLNTGYRAGVNVNIPLYELFGRQHRVQVYKHELEAKDEQRKNLELELARRVIYEYNYTISAHRMLMISSENLQAALMHQTMADKEFKEGSIPVSESARISEFTAKAKIDFEVAKREFFQWYLQLERLLGVRMDTLVRTN